MSNFLDLSVPWWHFVVRGGIAYVGLLILLRLTGKRAFGEMSPFDIVVLILVGGALRSAIVGSDTSVLGPLIAVTAILALDRLLGVLTAHSRWLNRLVEGSPLPLARDGALIPGALKRATLSPDAFARELRLHELPDLKGVALVQLEPNGRISVLKRE